MTSTYGTRNLFYIRISRGTVLPMYLYLDERHVSWMSDVVLQHVLADLQPFILPKLRSEYASLRATGAAHKPSTVDTYRGDAYQFCYFIRKTEPHTVVIKTRSFHAVPPGEKPAAGVSATSTTTPVVKKGKVTRGKRPRGKEPTPNPSKPKKRKRAHARRQEDEESDEEVIDDDDDDDDYAPVPSRQAEEEDDDDVEMLEPEANPELATEALQLEIEEQEEKPKPRLQLSYSGFNIYGQCLCVVVEPWKDPKAPQPNEGAGPSIAPKPATQPKELPLFLPEDDDEPELVVMDQDEDDTYGMLAMSQVLQSGGDTRTGGAHDDDGADDAVFFGDADEVRNL